VAQEVPGTTGIEEVPETLLAQVPVIVEVLAALGIARVGAPGYEADDVIGTLTARAVAEGAGPVDIVTGDRDLFQLVDDAAGVRVLYPARGIRDPDVVDEARLAEKYGVASGQAYADMATLRGDPSDGLPGVPGVGEKTAAKLLGQYGTLAGILTARDAGDKGLTTTQRRRLLEADDYLRVAPVVVQVARDAPLPELDPAVPKAPADPDALDALTARWGLRSSVDRVRTAFGWA
jgi:5'-3' exonuclease